MKCTYTIDTIVKRVNSKLPTVSFENMPQALSHSRFGVMTAALLSLFPLFPFPLFADGGSPREIIVYNTCLVTNLTSN